MTVKVIQWVCLDLHYRSKVWGQ